MTTLLPKSKRVTWEKLLHWEQREVIVLGPAINRNLKNVHWLLPKFDNAIGNPIMTPNFIFPLEVTIATCLVLVLNLKSTTIITLITKHRTITLRETKIQLLRPFKKEYYLLVCLGAWHPERKKWKLTGGGWLLFFFFVFNVFTQI